MKTNHIYIAAGAVVFVFVGFLLWSGDEIKDIEDVVSIDITTPTNTQNTNANPKPPSSNATSPKPPSQPPYQTPPTGSPGSPQATPTIPTASNLNGKIFKLVSYNGSTISAGGTYTLAFDNGRLSAKFCNSMSGNFVLDGGLLKAPNLASTLMYCGTPSNLMDIETLFGSMLGYGALIYQSGNQIVLSRSPGGVLVFQGF
mgnify:CR=1 FL=1